MLMDLADSSFWSNWSTLKFVWIIEHGRMRAEVSEKEKKKGGALRVLNCNILHPPGSRLQFIAVLCNSMGIKIKWTTCQTF